MGRMSFVRLLTLVFVLNLTCGVVKHSRSGGESQVPDAATSDGGPSTGRIPSNLQMDRDAAYLPSSQIYSPVVTISLACTTVANDPFQQPCSAPSTIAVSSIVKRQHVFRI